MPTASADNSDDIAYFNNICKYLSIEPYVLRVWISSEHADKSFEDILLDMDAIIIGGGNTLNMLGIWQAQEIDKVLGKALEKGIVLAGGSAGSICWFQNGVSDSRPITLSSVSVSAVYAREKYCENLNAPHPCSNFWEATPEH